MGILVWLNDPEELALHFFKFSNLTSFCYNMRFLMAMFLVRSLLNLSYIKKKAFDRLFLKYMKCSSKLFLRLLNCQVFGRVAPSCAWCCMSKATERLLGSNKYRIVINLARAGKKKTVYKAETERKQKGNIFNRRKRNGGNTRPVFSQFWFSN